jgi:hypothetical protein
MKRVDYLLRNHDNESRKQGAANPRDRKELKEMRKVFHRAQDRKSLHQLAVDVGSTDHGPLAPVFRRFLKGALASW